MINKNCARTARRERDYALAFLRFSGEELREFTLALPELRCERVFSPRLLPFSSASTSRAA